MPTWGFVVRVIIKAVMLFVIFNLAFALFRPLPAIGHLSVYNWLVPGRERLPYGESADAYNLSLDSLDAMFASHAVSAPKAPDEFRVFVLGDSSVWGVLLENADTLTGNINKQAIAFDLDVEGKRIVAYNLGHPILSVTKDLMLLDYAMRYEPDMIIWMVTLESLQRDEQLTPPLVQANADHVQRLIQQFGIDLAFEHDAADETATDFGTYLDVLMDESIIGKRRELADWWRLQMYGFAWAQTGIDQVYRDYDLRSNDFEADATWHDLTEGDGVDQDTLAFDVLEAGIRRAFHTPILLVNEPIFIADGENSDIRYNFWYPRWVYDTYRDLLADFMARAPHVELLDVWNSIPPSAFTDSPVHLTPQGSAQLASIITTYITDTHKTAYQPTTIKAD